MTIFRGDNGFIITLTWTVIANNTRAQNYQLLVYLLQLSWFARINEVKVYNCL